MSNLSRQLKLLANGVNPETGEVLGKLSLTNKPEVIRMLFLLADELDGAHQHNTEKKKLTPEERRQKNIAEGRPARSHFPWSDEEKAKLQEEFKKTENIVHLSQLFERSRLAIAVQLKNLELITEEQLESYRHDLA